MPGPSTVSIWRSLPGSTRDTPHDLFQQFREVVFREHDFEHDETVRLVKVRESAFQIARGLYTHSLVSPIWPHHLGQQCPVPSWDIVVALPRAVNGAFDGVA